MEMVRPGDFLGTFPTPSLLSLGAPLHALYTSHYMQALTPDLFPPLFFYRHDAMVLPLPGPRQRRETGDYPRSDILLLRFGYAVETGD